MLPGNEAKPSCNMISNPTTQSPITLRNVFRISRYPTRDRTVFLCIYLRHKGSGDLELNEDTFKGIVYSTLAFQFVNALPGIKVQRDEIAAISILPNGQTCTAW